MVFRTSYFIKQTRFQTARKWPKITQIQCFLFMEVDIKVYFRLLKWKVSICKDGQMGMIFVTTYFIKQARFQATKISNRSQTAKNSPNTVHPFHGGRYYNLLLCAKIRSLYLQRQADGNHFRDDQLYQTRFQTNKIS